MTNDVRERMQETAGLVTATLPPGTGFVILAFDVGTANGRLEYISNCARNDVVKVLEEFIRKTRDKWMKHQS